jgi:hypothetical protein
MPRYRCYFVDGEDHIDDVANLEAHTLTAVIGKALALLAPHPDHSIEIWQSEKRLYRSSNSARSLPRRWPALNEA